MSKDVKIKNNRPRIYTANGVTLQPGLNTLTAADAESFLSHPHMQIKVERDLIELGDGAKMPKGTAKKAAAKKSKKEEAAEKKAADEAATEAAAENEAAANSGDEGDADAFADLPYSIDGLNAKDAIAKIKVIEDVDYLMHVAENSEFQTVIDAAQNRALELTVE